uniref:Uncharacterized protein n=1 Tax=Leersia perrieri TaxID=77586 RepID=A0A0D9XPT4_9ORYZ
MSSLEEPLGLGDLPKLSINRLERFSPSACRASADDCSPSNYKHRKFAMVPTIRQSFTAVLIHGMCEANILIHPAMGWIWSSELFHGRLPQNRMNELICSIMSAAIQHIIIFTFIAK